MGPLQLLGQMGLDGAHGHIQNKGHGCANQKGHEQPGHRAQKTAYTVHILQAPVKQDAEGGNAQYIA